MKRKMILIPTLALLMLFAVVAPVMAAPAQKIPVTADTYDQEMDYTNMRELKTDDGIIHRWGIVRTGKVDLTVEGQPTISGELYEEFDVLVNSKTGEWVIRYSPCVWAFDEGSFEGVKQARRRFYASGTMMFEQHAVFQGSGIFEGCTLMISMEPGTSVYVGLLLIH